MVFALSLLYDEIVLNFMSGEGSPFLYRILFGAAVGLAVSAVCMMLDGALAKHPKVHGLGFWLAVIFSELAAVFFAAEAVIKDIFTFYYSPASMITGVGGVVSQYEEELKAGVLAGVPKFLIFSLPVAVVVLVKFLILKKKPAKAAGWLEKVSAWLEKISSGFKEKTRLKSVYAVALLLALAAVGLFAGARGLVLSGRDAALYGAHYNFNNAVDTFGLSEALVLSVGRGENGDSAQAFAEVEGEFFTTDVAGTDAAGAENPAGGDPAALANGDSSLIVGGDASAEAAAQTPHEPEYNAMEIAFPHEGVASSVDKLSTYLEGTAPSEKNEYTGLFAGKNLIMICAESYCDAFITPKLTPTLWRLTTKGLHFTDYYQPSWGGSTTTGEVSMVLGLDSNDGADAMARVANNNHYFTMGNQLQRQGYFSLAFHNGAYTYYDRNRTHTNIGYDAFFASSHHLNTLCGHNYPTDTEMFEGTFPTYVNHQPFSVYYMTVSGHASYNKDSPYVKKYYDHVNEVVGNRYQEKTKYYICYQMELESALTSLVSMLEEAGIADDTVLVITGDHYPYGLGKGWCGSDYIHDLVRGSAAVPWEADKSGLMIWSGCLEKDLKSMACTVSTPTMSLDILPTVSNLFGVEFDSRLLPGRDMLADTEPLVYWNNRSWVTDKGKYSTRKHEFTPAPGVEMTPEEENEYIEATSRQVENKILMSTTILKQDYYRLIFGDDNDGADPEKVWEQIQAELAK